MVFTTPAIRALRRHYPDAHLTYLVEPPAAPVVRLNPHLDELIVVERPRGLARLGYDLALARRLRASRFDLVIDFHGGPRSAWLTRATGARERIGYALPHRRWAYTTRLPWSRSLVPPRHSVLDQWALLAPLGIAPPDPTRDAMEMPLDASAVARVGARLQQAAVPAEARLVVIHVSAGNPFRRWPTASFAALASHLAAQHPLRRIVLSSGPSDAAAAARIAEAARATLGAAAHRIVRVGEFDLAELRALVERAELYVGGDSGPLHIAGTTRTPIVALLGPTLPERCLPWRDPTLATIGVDVGALPCRPCHQHTCVPGDFRCLTGITTAMVAAACDRALVTSRSGATPGNSR